LQLVQFVAACFQTARARMVENRICFCQPMWVHHQGLVQGVVYVLLLMNTDGEIATLFQGRDADEHPIIDGVTVKSKLPSSAIRFHDAIWRQTS
jgi:hypothetical protein